jgi:LPXTG-motif cell wall-anchored protein
MQKRLAPVVVAGGIVALVFAFELRTWHGRGSWTGDPKGKVLIASWLASELWLNPWLLVLGLAALVTAIVLLLRGRRKTA